MQVMHDIGHLPRQVRGPSTSRSMAGRLTNRREITAAHLASQQQMLRTSSLSLSYSWGKAVGSQMTKDEKGKYKTSCTHNFFCFFYKLVLGELPAIYVCLLYDWIPGFQAHEY